jgi:hypothetical protein
LPDPAVHSQSRRHCRNFSAAPAEDEEIDAEAYGRFEEKLKAIVNGTQAGVAL